jgi:WD40 repeat protein
MIKKNICREVATLGLMVFITANSISSPFLVCYAPVNSLSITPDSKILIAGGGADFPKKKTEIRIIETVSKWEKPKPAALSGNIVSVASSPDSRWAATVSTGGQVLVFDTETAEVHLSLRPHARPQAACFSTSESLLFTGGADGLIKGFELAEGQEIRSYKGHVKGVTGICSAPKGSLFASGGNDGLVIIWKAQTGEHKILAGHTGPVTCVAWSPDGKHIASGSEDHTVRIWDAETGKLQATLTTHQRSVKTLTFSPDGRFIVSGGDSQELQWHTTKEFALFQTQTTKPHSITALTIAPTSHAVYYALSNSEIHSVAMPKVYGR